MNWEGSTGCSVEEHRGTWSTPRHSFGQVTDVCLLLTPHVHTSLQQSTHPPTHRTNDKTTRTRAGYTPSHTAWEGREVCVCVCVCTHLSAGGGCEALHGAHPWTDPFGLIPLEQLDRELRTERRGLARRECGPVEAPLRRPELKARVVILRQRVGTTMVSTCFSKRFGCLSVSRQSAVC